MVIFGAGDLLHRKLMPSLFHLHGRRAAARGLRRRHGGARADGRRRLPDAGAATRSRPSRPNGGGLDQEAWGRFAPRLHYVSGELNDPRDLRRAAAAAGARSTPGCRAGSGRLFYLAIPPSLYARHHQPPGRVGHRAAGAGSQAAALGAGHHREAVRPEPGERGGAERLCASRLRRAPGLPHRPLPGQGDGPEPPGVPVRQLDLRAGVEPPARAPRADHRGGERGRRASGQVLRGSGRGARHVSEPPAAAAHADGDGAAGHLQRRRGARREGQGAPRHPADHARRDARLRGARPVRPGHDRRQAGARLPAGAGRRSRQRDARPTAPSAS